MLFVYKFRILIYAFLKSRIKKNLNLKSMYKIFKGLSYNSWNNRTSCLVNFNATIHTYIISYIDIYVFFKPVLLNVYCIGPHAEILLFLWLFIFLNIIDFGVKIFYHMTYEEYCSLYIINVYDRYINYT